MCVRACVRACVCVCVRVCVCVNRNDSESPIPLSQTCADPEGGQGVRTPLKNHKNIGFLSNTGLDPLKITKLPSQHSMLGHH